MHPIVNEITAANLAVATRECVVNGRAVAVPAHEPKVGENNVELAYHRRKRKEKKKSSVRDTGREWVSFRG